jgi:hypothetical protein
MKAKNTLTQVISTYQSLTLVRVTALKQDQISLKAIRSNQLRRSHSISMTSRSSPHITLVETDKVTEVPLVQIQMS